MSHSDDSSDSEPPRSRTGKGRRFALVIERGMRGGRIPRRLLTRAIHRVARSERAEGELRLVIADNRTMRRLNRDFRSKDRATDVLSFPEGRPFPGQSGLCRIGEIYCNYDHAIHWSQKEGGSASAELARLAVHGMLHLLGYDHHTDSERRVMAEKEDRYLAGAGLIAARGAT